MGAFGTPGTLSATGAARLQVPANRSVEGQGAADEHGQGWPSLKCRSAAIANDTDPAMGGGRVSAPGGTASLAFDARKLTMSTVIVVLEARF